jgi:hypothetical protein
LELDASAAARPHLVFLSDGMNREAEQRALAASDRWSPGDALIFVTWQNWREGPDSPAATRDARPI